MIHRHQFVYAGVAQKVVGPPFQPRSVEGASYVCFHLDCGELRHAFPDGDVKVIKEGLSEKEELE